MGITNTWLTPIHPTRRVCMKCGYLLTCQFCQYDVLTPSVCGVFFIVPRSKSRSKFVQKIAFLKRPNPGHPNPKPLANRAFMFKFISFLKHRSWVRIPPSPPTKTPHSVRFEGLFYFPRSKQRSKFVILPPFYTMALPPNGFEPRPIRHRLGGCHRSNDHRLRNYARIPF